MTDNDYTPRIPDALPPGYRFDEFEIQEVIDSTHTGIVYQAWDHQLERSIAIREFMPRALTVRSDEMQLVLRSKQDRLAFTAGLNGFTQEARLLAHFNHPNLLQVLRFWVQNETAYTATLFSSGITLAELHKQQPEIITESWIRRMLPMLCDALAALHESGFIHRALSLKSIQIQNNGIPMLLNVGIACRAAGNLSDESKTLLQAGFAPLEQYADDLENQLGPWTDIYALGAVLYTLITGASPPASATRSIQDSCVPLTKSRPEGYSTTLLHAVDRALALKPEDRPRSIEEFTALADIPVGGMSERASVKKTGTMLVAIAEEKTIVSQSAWKRYKSPLQITAGVVVGVFMGAVMFSSNAPDVTGNPVVKTQRVAEAVKTTPVAQSAAVNNQIARVYIRMNEGEALEVNGKTQNLAPAVNGYGSLELKAGKYDIKLSDHNRSRSMTLSIEKPGTWLVNPQG